MRDITLYFRYVRMHIKSELQYRGWWIKLLLVLFTMATDPLEVLLLFDRFGSIGEWSPSRILLLYGMCVCAFGLAETFGRGFDYFPVLVKNGDFDRILLRPRSLFVQTAAARFHLHRVCRVVGGLVLSVLALRAQGVSLAEPLSLAMFLLALAGGCLMYIGVFLFQSALTFFTIEAVSFSYIFTNGSYQVAKAPPTYMPDWLRRMFLYVVPMFAFSWLPASALCGWGASRALGWVALPAGGGFFLIALFTFLVCSRRYRSTGS